MDFTKLRNNIIEMLREQQIKLGFMRETVRLYYPLQSLNRFLDCDVTSDEMMMILDEFAKSVKAEMGTLEVSYTNDRFCIMCGPDVSEYVRDHMDGAEFLRELIGLVSKHGTQMTSVISLFKKYSDQVHIETEVSDEFDYLIYFENGIPDDFRYCITDEGEHLIYHRFTADDYHDIYGE